MPELGKSLWLFPSMSVNSAGRFGILFRDQLARPIRFLAHTFITSYLTKCVGFKWILSVDVTWLAYMLCLKSFFISLLRFRIFSRRNYFSPSAKKNQDLENEGTFTLLIIDNNWHRVEAHVLPSVP